MMLSYMVIDIDVFDNQEARFFADKQSATWHAENMAGVELVEHVELYERFQIPGDGQMYQMIRRFK